MTAYISTSASRTAQATFGDLRNRGIKCSTNITPIISNRDPSCSTYNEGLTSGYFVTDSRFNAEDPNGRRYQNFSGIENFYQFTDPEGNFNSGNPYIGEEQSPGARQ